MVHRVAAGINDVRESVRRNARAAVTSVGRVSGRRTAPSPVHTHDLTFTPTHARAAGRGHDGDARRHIPRRTAPGPVLAHDASDVPHVTCVTVWIHVRVPLCLLARWHLRCTHDDD